MINIIFLLSCVLFQKDESILPFAKVDTINSHQISINYACFDKWIKSNKFLPVYMGDQFVGAGVCSHIDKKGWVFAKVFLNRKIDQEYSLRINMKVHKSEFNQDGCYWQINDAEITKFVFLRNASKYE